MWGAFDSDKIASPLRASLDRLAANDGDEFMPILVPKKLRGTEYHRSVHSMKVLLLFEPCPVTCWGRKSRDAPRDCRGRGRSWNLPWGLTWKRGWSFTWKRSWNLPWDLTWKQVWSLTWQRGWHMPWNLTWKRGGSLTWQRVLVHHRSFGHLRLDRHVAPLRFLARGERRETVE